MTENENKNQIKLTSGEIVKVSPQDYDSLSTYKWGNTNGYAARWDKKTKKTVYMHRQILNPPKGLIAEHKNHDSLDNTRENLRMATNTQNMCNRRLFKNNKHKLKGVYYRKDLKEKKWKSQICINKKLKFLGYFKTKEAAHQRYCEVGKAIFGDFFFKG